MSVVRFRHGDRVVRVPLYLGYPPKELANLLGGVLGLDPVQITAVSNADVGTVPLAQLCHDKRYTACRQSARCEA